jgi:hypothetical protein
MTPIPLNDAQVERALRIAGVTMILAVAVVELGRWRLTDKGRFRGGNAYGATANAVEAMRSSLKLWFSAVYRRRVPYVCQT